MNPLQVFPRHPSAPDTYYINGAWAPAAITAVDKRFTDAELAAEYHCMDSDCQIAWIDGEHTDAMQERFDTLERFATLPHHDDGPA